MALIGEPSGLNPLPKAVIIGEKGHLILKMVTHGKSAHSMAPSMGKNAIYMMSKIIEKLDTLPNYVSKIDPPFTLEELKQLISTAFVSRERFDQIYNDQPELQSIINTLTEFTYSLNVINGGIKVNVIPDRCEALIDFRLLPGQSSDIIISGVKKLITSLGYYVTDKPSEKLSGDIYVELEVQRIGASSIWREFDKSRAVDKFKNIVAEVYGKEPFYFVAPGCTDAHYYRNSGYCKNTIHFGPGSARQAHAINENIEIQDYVNAIKVYSLFAYYFLTEE
jgi:succinyl-diaminopimelate desuccinylase